MQLIGIFFLHFMHILKIPSIKSYDEIGVNLRGAKSNLSSQLNQHDFYCLIIFNRKTYFKSILKKKVKLKHNRRGSNVIISLFVLSFTNSFQ